MAKRITMKKLDEVLSKGCRDSLKTFFDVDESLTDFTGDKESIGTILLKGFGKFKSPQYKKVDAEYYALANGPCGIFAGTQEQKLRYKRDLEELMGKI